MAGPTFWNSLADELRTYASDRLKLALNTFLFATYQRIQRIRGMRNDALYKLTIDVDISPVLSCPIVGRCRILAIKFHYETGNHGARLPVCQSTATASSCLDES